MTGGNVKSNILFFDTEHCSGCLLCEMACSLIQKGECSRDGSFIKVAIHPYLSVPTVFLSMHCNCPDGQERCLEICNQQALRFVPRDEAIRMLTEKKWYPSPVIEKAVETQ
jgi:Fe-S-cluster-containing hydrogenase component 2